jgi:hypothetical protein
MVVHFIVIVRRGYCYGSESFHLVLGEEERSTFDDAASLIRSQKRRRREGGRGGIQTPKEKRSRSEGKKSRADITSKGTAIQIILIHYP